MLARIIQGIALVVAIAAAALGGATHWRPSLDGIDRVTPSPASALRPGELRAQFFGTSTVLISDGTTTLMVDGFFSRPSWWRLLAMPLAPDDQRIAQALSAGHVTSVDAIFVAHSHHDHAMDSARVALATHATLHGTASTLNIARGERFPAAQMRPIQTGQKIRIGEFVVTAIEGRHSPDPVFPGVIDEPLHYPVRLAGFKEAQNHVFLLEHPRGNTLIIPSANFIPGALDGVKADVVFLGVGGLGRQAEAFFQQYWSETVAKTGARRIIPIHWDDFGLGLDAPLKPMPFALDRVDIAAELLRHQAEAAHVKVTWPTSFVTFSLP